LKHKSNICEWEARTVVITSRNLAMCGEGMYNGVHVRFSFFGSVRFFIAVEERLKKRSCPFLKLRNNLL
jgi:hypothetical protein